MAAAAGADDENALAFNRHAEVIEPLDEADAVEQSAVEPAIGQATHRIDGAGNARHRVGRVDQRGQLRLVRDGGPQPADVLGRDAVLQERRQILGRELQRHQHRIDAVALEELVVDLGCAHLRDRIAEDEVDARRAGDFHAAVSCCSSWCST